jgi:hypothetical protein
MYDFVLHAFINRKRRGKATIVQDDDVIPSDDEGGDADVEDEGGAKRKGKRRVISKAFVSSSEGSEDEATERVC